MAIDKITPHRLDKTSDFKVVPKTSMVDALNILISEDAAFGGSVVFHQQLYQMLCLKVILKLLVVLQTLN